MLYPKFQAATQLPSGSCINVLVQQSAQTNYHAEKQDILTRAHCCVASGAESRGAKVSLNHADVTREEFT